MMLDSRDTVHMTDRCT